MFAIDYNYTEIEIAKNLIDAKASINNKSIFDRTELMMACNNDNYSLVEYLIKHGADINSISTYGPIVIPL